MTQKTVIYVDVFDTLEGCFYRDHPLVLEITQHIKSLKEQGAVLYCWRSSGADYARQSAAEFGIEDCFVAFLPKPNAILDDQSIEQWRYFRQVHPAECDGMTLDDYNAR